MDYNLRTNTNNTDFKNLRELFRRSSVCIIERRRTPRTGRVPERRSGEDDYSG